MTLCCVLAVIFISTTLLIYKYLTRNRGFWRSRGIPEAPGSVIGFGHALDYILSRKNVAGLIEYYYQLCPQNSVLGIYMGQSPILIIKHPDLIKFVLTSGSSHFSENPTLDEKLDPLMSHDPFFKNGQEWKDARGIFLSAFSSKKLKDRSPAISRTCQLMLNHLEQRLANNGSIDVEAKQLFSRFTLAVATDSILSIESHTFSEENQRSSLQDMMNAVFSTKRGAGFKEIVLLLFPIFGRFFSQRYLPESVNDFFLKIVSDITSARSNEEIVRNDILQHISDCLKQSGLPEHELPAHAFGFLLEQYETSSLTLSFVTYFAAKYPRIQEKMREEVDKVVKRFENVYSYEAINKMTYIEMVIKECLRFLPPIGSLLRICSRSVSWQGPDGFSCNLKKGDTLQISTLGLHRDNMFWDDPEAFIPERFERNRQNERTKFVYLPFGDGPRSCPGSRMAVLQIKAGIAAILKDYIIEKSDKMEEPVQIDPRYFVTAIDGGVWVQLRSRF